MSVEVVHVGRRIRVEVDTLHAPGGQTIRRDAIRHPGAVVILPVLDAERVVLLRNFRFVVNDTLWEVPAGTVEPGEPLEEYARRELLEETGYTAEVAAPRLHLRVAGGAGREAAPVRRGGADARRGAARAGRAARTRHRATG